MVNEEPSLHVMDDPNALLRACFRTLECFPVFEQRLLTHPTAFRVWQLLLTYGFVPAAHEGALPATARLPLAMLLEA